MSEFGRNTGSGIRSGRGGRGRGTRHGRPSGGNNRGRGSTHSSGYSKNYSSYRHRPPPPAHQPSLNDIKVMGEAGMRHTSPSGRESKDDQDERTKVPDLRQQHVRTEGEGRREAGNRNRHQYEQPSKWRSDRQSERSQGQGDYQADDECSQVGEDNYRDQRYGPTSKHRKHTERPPRACSKSEHKSQVSHSSSENMIESVRVDKLDYGHSGERTARSETGKSRRPLRHKPGSDPYTQCPPPSSCQGDTKSYGASGNGKHVVLPHSQTMSQQTKSVNIRRGSTGEEGLPHTESIRLDTKSSEETSSKRPVQKMPRGLCLIFQKGLHDVMSQPESHASPIDGRITPPFLVHNITDQNTGHVKKGSSGRKTPTSGRGSPCATPPSCGRASPCVPLKNIDDAPVSQSSTETNINQHLHEKASSKAQSQIVDDFTSNSHKDIHSSKVQTDDNATVDHSEGAQSKVQVMTTDLVQRAPEAKDTTNLEPKSKSAAQECKDVVRLKPESEVTTLTLQQSRVSTNLSAEFATLTLTSSGTCPAVCESTCKHVETVTQMEVGIAKCADRSSIHQGGVRCGNIPVVRQQSVKSETANTQQKPTPRTTLVVHQHSVKLETANTQQKPTPRTTNLGSAKGGSSQTSAVNSSVESTPTKRRKNKPKKKKTPAKDRMANGQSKIANIHPKQNVCFGSKSSSTTSSAHCREKSASVQQRTTSTDLTMQHKWKPRNDSADALDLGQCKEVNPRTNSAHCRKDKVTQWLVQHPEVKSTSSSHADMSTHMDRRISQGGRRETERKPPDVCTKSSLYGQRRSDRFSRPLNKVHGSNRGQTDGRRRPSNSAHYPVSNSTGGFGSRRMSAGNTDKSVHNTRPSNSAGQASTQSHDTLRYNNSAPTNNEQTLNNTDALNNADSVIGCKPQENSIPCSESWDVPDDPEPDQPSRFGKVAKSNDDDDCGHMAQSEDKASQSGATVMVLHEKTNLVAERNLTPENDDSPDQRSQSDSPRKTTSVESPSHGGSPEVTCGVTSSEEPAPCWTLTHAGHDPSHAVPYPQNNFVNNSCKSHPSRNQPQNMALSPDKRLAVDPESFSPEMKQQIVKNLIAMMMTSPYGINALYPDLQNQKQHTLVQNCEKVDSATCHVPPYSDKKHGMMSGEVVGMLHHAGSSADTESAANMDIKGNTRDASSLCAARVLTADSTTHGYKEAGGRLSHSELNDSHTSCVQSKKNVVNTSDITETVSKPRPSPGPPQSCTPHSMNSQDPTREYAGHLPQKGRSGAVPQDDVPMCYQGGGEKITGHAVSYHVANMSARCEALPFSKDTTTTSPGSETLPPWKRRTSDPVNFQELAGNAPPPPPPPTCPPRDAPDLITNSHQHNKRKMQDYDSAQKRRGPHVGHQGNLWQYEHPRQTYATSPTRKTPTRKTPTQSSPQFIPPRLLRLQQQNQQGHGNYHHLNPLDNQNYSQHRVENFPQRGFNWQGQDQQHSRCTDQNHWQKGDRTYSHHGEQNYPRDRNQWQGDQNQSRGDQNDRPRGDEYNSQNVDLNYLQTPWQHRDQSTLHKGHHDHSPGMHGRDAELFSPDNQRDYGPRGHVRPPWHGNTQRGSQNMPQERFHREFDVADLPRGYNQNLPDYTTDRSNEQNRPYCGTDRPLLAPSVDLGGYEPPPIPPPDHPERKTNPARCSDAQTDSPTETGAEDVRCGRESPDVFDDGYEEKLLRDLFDSDTETINSTDGTANSPVPNGGAQTGGGNVAPLHDRLTECEIGEIVDGGPHACTVDAVGEVTTLAKSEETETIDCGTNNNVPLNDSGMVKDNVDSVNPADGPKAQAAPCGTELSVPDMMENVQGCCQDLCGPVNLPSCDVSDHAMLYDVQVPSADSKNPEIANIVDNSKAVSSQENVPAIKSEKRVYIPPHKRWTSAVNENIDRPTDGRGTKSPTTPQLEGSSIGKQKGPQAISGHNESPFKHPQEVDLNPSWRKPRVYDPPLSMHIFTPPSVDILCDESWSPNVKKHDQTPLGEALQRTNSNAISQRKLFSASEDDAGTDNLSQSLGGRNRLGDDSDKKETACEKLMSKCVDDQTDTEQSNAASDKEVLVSYEKRGIRRTYSDSVLGKENMRKNKPVSRKDGVQGESELILTAKEPPRQQQQRRNKQGGRHSLGLGATQSSRHSLGLGVTLERLKGSFQGDQQLASNPKNVDNDSGPPDWFDDPDNAASVSYTYTPPTTTNRFSVLGALDDNSSATDSDASPSMNLQARRRRTRWSDPPAPSLMDTAVPTEEQKWQKTFRDHYNRLNTVYFDTHCHLDFILKRSKFMGSYEKYRVVNKWTYPDTYAGCLAVFCDPRTFGNQGMWKDILADPTVWGAVGCHPKCATEFDSVARMNLIEMLKESKVKALGEIGLDYSGTFHQHKDRQIEVLRDQIGIALTSKLPLVIHSRDAEEDCLRILRETVPSPYRIHRHCFTGCWAEAEEWLRYFPESYIGLTPLMTHSGGRSIAPREVAKNIPLDRLLLETDAPYFLPKQIPRDTMAFSHPGMAVTVAAEVARLQGVNIEDVLAHCLQNSEKMYGITINKTPGAHWPGQTQQ